MRSFAIGSLTLVSNNVLAPGFILQTPIVGLDAPDYRIGLYARPGQDGGVVSSMFYDSRVVTLTGTIYAGDPATFEALRQQFEVACAISKDSNGFPKATRVSFTTMAGTSLYFDAYIDRPQMNYDQPNYARFLVTMTATNPFLFSPAAINSGNISAPSGGGFILPVLVPITSSPTVGGLVVVNNPGNVDVSPKITVYGLMTSPVITNQTTGKSIQLNYTVTAGNTAEIDMYEHAITFNTSSSLNGAKSASSDWWKLQPGDNTIAVGSSLSSDTGYCVITANPGFLGV